MEKKENKQVGNPRKGKILYYLWVDKNESKMIDDEKYEESIPSLQWGIIKEAKKRGDFYKV